MDSSNLHNILVSSDKCLVGGGDEGDVAGDVRIGVATGFRDGAGADETETGAGAVVVAGAAYAVLVYSVVKFLGDEARGGCCCHPDTATSLS